MYLETDNIQLQTNFNLKQLLLIRLIMLCNCQVFSACFGFQVITTTDDRYYSNTLDLP